MMKQESPLLMEKMETLPPKNGKLLLYCLFYCLFCCCLFTPFKALQILKKKCFGVVLLFFVFFLPSLLSMHLLKKRFLIITSQRGSFFSFLFFSFLFFSFLFFFLSYLFFFSFSFLFLFIDGNQQHKGG